ncbi:MAG: MIP family channel protein [Gemmatimonadetes bacterium]|nr:MIP family channel protein [Gemmatimonadota bacterium]MXX12969.1 MIP family channel protein [Gemmatimonadota bacterium]MYB55020.1 MIP family channel protein [Gemmatimonadota bacterium]
MDTVNLLKKCSAEFIGAFAIVFGGCGAVAINQLSEGAITHVGIATSFGLIVMTMVYATGHISGAHFNPAVTTAFAFTRHFPKREILPYIAAQCLGAIAASGIHLWSLTPILKAKHPQQTLNLGVTQPMDNLFATAFIWEFLLTFFLMLVIMAVATDYRATGQAAGLAIGGTIWFEAMFAGPLCGASMNPARSLGPALVSGDWTHFPAYVLGPILGATAGAFFYEFIRCHSDPGTDAKGCC